MALYKIWEGNTKSVGGHKNSVKETVTVNTVNVTKQIT